MTVTRKTRKLFFSPVVPALILTGLTGMLAFGSASSRTPDDGVPLLESAQTTHTLQAGIAPAKAADLHALINGVSEVTAEFSSAVDLTEPVQSAGARQRVVDYISRSFRVPLARAQEITDAAIEVGEIRDMDPLLILAVIGTESSFNPNARSYAGAEGLMQVMTRVHASRFKAFGGNAAAFDPYANIVVGTAILSDMIRRTGSVRAGLKHYSGAANLPNDRGYAARVMHEHSLLGVAARGEADRATSLALSRKRAQAHEVASASARNLSFARWTRLQTAGETARVKTMQNVKVSRGTVSGS